ncbi:class I SAM-dependent methyltransferase [Georgenia yuyongxinii]|uniref:Class I SAM-dependent methyltransferase n=1 Tax=Georgenia yuyongxinii TaxID=2589797 RepID=A0A552WQN3_9MICO|nr:methyltransferase [Georgenia yuyongxinii]TRW45045.1 class I SAM-dependent methyltransferase [Georgenia yuyongxinii]
MPTPDHYFSAEPASAAELRPLHVHLRGHDVRVLAAPGVFSGDRLDLGTRVLLDAVGDPPTAGTLVDVGCGWGPITLAMALASPGAQVYGVDVNRRAVELTRRNAAALGLGHVTALDAEDALSTFAGSGTRIDEIWSNPPIRIGKQALHELLRRWLGLLAPTGRAQLVVQKNLGADSLHRWLEVELAQDVTRAATSKGFRVLTVRPRSR